MPDKYDGRIFPPLGQFELTAGCGVVAIGFLCTYLVFVCYRSHPYISPLHGVSLLLTVMALLAIYSGLNLRFVKPGTNGTLVSIGYDRTDFARKNYDDKTDIEMLRDYGSRELEIEKLWTYKSLAIARGLLLLTYTTIIMSFIWFFCIGALQHASEQVRKQLGVRKSE